MVLSSLRFRLSLASLCLASFAAANCGAQQQCEAPLHDLEPGIVEMSFPDVSVKIESNHRTIKMKIPQAFGTNKWTWASVKGSAAIKGIVSKGGRRATMSELVAVEAGPAGELNWAMFRPENPFLADSKGMAYFMIQGTLYCVPTSLSDWDISVQKVLGSSINETSAIEARSADDVYHHLGLNS